MSKILKNNTASPVNIADVGQIVPASGQLTVQPTDYWLYADSANVITFIGDSTLTVNDGSSDLGISDGSKLIQGIFPNPVGIAAGDDGTPIGHVSDSLKVTSGGIPDSFDTSGGVVVGITETTIILPAGTLRYDLQTLGVNAAVLTIAGAATGTGADATSFRIHPGNTWSRKLSGENSLTIYIKSSIANTTVQVVAWS